MFERGVVWFERKNIAMGHLESAVFETCMISTSILLSLDSK